MNRRHSFVAFTALLGGLLFAGAGEAQELPRTWQEVNNYRAGPTPFEPLMDFWYDLAAVSPEVSIQPLTHTILDREFTLVTIANEPIHTPQDALRSGKAIVLLANSVHGGEVSPKEAAQLIAKELVGGELRSVLDDVIVLVVPIVNPDGGEILRRTNEEGFDMNRDYVKMESQEITALITQVMNEWTPDVHLDGHHGGSAPYTITWQGTLNPAADSALRAYPYERMFPRVRAALQAEDYDGFDYSGVRSLNGVEGWGSTSVEPRKHHVYSGLVNSIGILTETPNNSRRVMRDGTLQEIAPEDRYYHQIMGQVILMRTILQVAAEESDEIRAVTSAARMRAIRAGQQGGDPIVLDYELASRGTEPVWMPDANAPLGYSVRNVPIYLRWQTTRTTTRPVGYVLPASMARVIPLLLDHDIAVFRFQEPTTLQMEVYDATRVQRNEYFQGHYLKSAEVRKSTEQVEVGRGWFYIPTAQSRANLISYILEPETDDNLITWGHTSHILQVTPETSEEAMQALLQGTPMSALSEEQIAELERRVQAQQAQVQRVPMMRVMQHQTLPVVRVEPGNGFDRNRFYRPTPR
jgi:dipeptidyl-peptidase 4